MPWGPTQRVSEAWELQVPVVMLNLNLMPATSGEAQSFPWRKFRIGLFGWDEVVALGRKLRGVWGTYFINLLSY